MWRADGNQLIESEPVKRGGTLITGPDLSDLVGTLTSLLHNPRGFPDHRVATPTMEPITEDRPDVRHPQVVSQMWIRMSPSGRRPTATVLDEPHRSEDCWILGLGRLGARSPRLRRRQPLGHSSLAVPGPGRAGAARATQRVGYPHRTVVPAHALRRDP